MDRFTVPLLLSSSCALFSLCFLSTPSRAQNCSSVTFSNNKLYTTCTTLPVLHASLHWTYTSSAGTADIAFLVTGVTSSNWVAWALNPTGQGMTGAQALVAFQNTTGFMEHYTSSVTSDSPNTVLSPTELSFSVDNLTAEFSGTQMVIFATVHLPGGQTTLNQVWQVGPLSGDTPISHALDGDHTSSMGTVDFFSGTASASRADDSSPLKKNVHGMLNAVSWGTLMPIGAMLARYVRVFDIGNPAWFYLHVTCQASAYLVGVAGFGTGLYIGSGEYETHRCIGITLFTLGTLQVLALFLRPKPDHKYRFYWNLYHHSIGYTVIILGILNVFKGLDILDPAKQWKKAYAGILLFLGCVALVLEAVKWLVFLKKKKKRSPPPQQKDSSYLYDNGNGNSTNEVVNGYRSQPTA